MGGVSKKEQDWRDLDYSNPLSCYDCGRAYSTPAWVEAVVANDVWEQIAPSRESVLCINCMAIRMVRCGLEDVPTKIFAGPMKVTNG